MKTKLFEKKNSLVKSVIESLSEKEMKEIYGGVIYIAIRDENGNVRVIVIP